MDIAPDRRSFYPPQPVKEPKVEVPVEESTTEPEPSVKPEVTEEKEVISEKYLTGLTKKEQVEMLEELGLDKTEVKKLKYEKDRVEKILELYN